MHAEVDRTLPLPGLSPVCGKPVVTRFDGGQLSSDGGIWLLAEVERRLRIAERLARCIEDPRAPDQIRHEVAEMIRLQRHRRYMRRDLLMLPALVRSVIAETGKRVFRRDRRAAACKIALRLPIVSPSV